ncbi:MAG: HU family DNA-binding protein [Paludibacteraceae bacterium]|nr:HU family DNA-binding protein [Paludibacteraceae bacterium]
MNKISTQEISEIVAKESAKSKKFSEQFLRELVSVIAEYLQKDGIVKVKGLGTFKVVTVEERKSVDVASGKEIILPAHNKIQFTAENSVKQTIKGQESNHRITESPHHRSYLYWIIILIVVVDFAALAYVSVPYWKPYYDEFMNKGESDAEDEFVIKQVVPDTEAVVEDTVATEPADTANTDVVEQPETVEQGITLENYTYQMAMEVPVKGTETVIDGSRLTMIAYRAYGSKDFWVYIYDANRDILHRPSDISTGMVLKIADLPLSIVNPNDEACIKKARELAKMY